MISFLSDLFLLNPIALVGLVSLLIPILIHLFNPSRGKLILIGNIDLIKKAKNIRLIEIKINQWLLLFIRLITFFLLSLMLADLVSQYKQDYEKQTKVFFSPDWLNNATETELDEVRTQHAADLMFLLAPDFAELSLVSFASPSGKINYPFSKITIDALLAELGDRDFLSEKNIIYTTNRAAAYLVDQSDVLSNPHLQWRIKSVNRTTEQSVVLNISVFYSPSRIDDYQYLKLAFNTLAKVSEIKLEVSYYPEIILGNDNLEDSLSGTKTDWIFWLSEKPVPTLLKQQTKQGSYLFVDMQGDLSLSKSNQQKPVAIQIEQFWNNFYSAQLPPLQPNYKPIWHNASGQIALSEKNYQGGKIFQFNSRFHPDWNDLIKTIQFPVFLAKLFSDSPRLTSQRQVSLSRLTDPREKPVSTKENDKEAKTVLKSIRPFLLMLLCVLWLIERLLSERRQAADD